MSIPLSSALDDYRPGDVVAAIGGNAPEIWKLLEETESRGLVLAPINDGWWHIDDLLERLGAQIVVVYGPRAEWLNVRHQADAVLEPGGTTLDGFERSDGRQKRPTSAHGLADGAVEGAVVFATSGSTGLPKCVVSTIKNRQFCVGTIGAYLGLREGQVLLNAYPASFDYGFYQGLLAARFGLELRTHPSLQRLPGLVDRVSSLRRVVLPLTPSVAARVCSLVRPGSELRGVDVVTLTGGGVSLGLRRELVRVFPHAKIFAMYGLTECKRVAFLDPAEFLQRPLSCGKPMAGVDVAMLDASGVVVSGAGSGELIISGPNVCAGFWGDPSATEAVFQTSPQGARWLRTGDQFRRDDAGYLEFLGRRDGVVKVRDERVSLAAIDSELRRSPLVMDLTLDVLLDDMGLPRLTALVVPTQPSLTDRDILRSFSEVVSRTGHLPDRVLLEGSLGLSEHGKTRRVIA